MGTETRGMVTMRAARFRRRGGYVLVLVSLALVTLLGMAALSLDVGTVVGVKQKAQDIADAAALAAAASLRTGMDETEAVQRAIALAAANQVMGVPVIMEEDDVEVGAWDEDTQMLVPWSPAFDVMAVKATVRYSEDSPNGPVPLHFSKALGHQFAETSAEAVASVGMSMHPRNPVDIMFVQDASGSFVEEWSQAINASSNLIDMINDVSIADDQYGIVVFDEGISTDGYYERQWSWYYRRYVNVWVSYELKYDLMAIPEEGDLPASQYQIRQSVEDHEPAGWTNPAPALDFAIDSILDNGYEGNEKVIVLVSDGMPLGSTSYQTQQYRNNTIAAADRAESNGIRIHTVTLTAEDFGDYGYGGADFEFNEGLVRNGGYAFRTADPERIRDILITVGGLEYGKAKLIK